MRSARSALALILCLALVFQAAFCEAVVEAFRAPSSLRIAPMTMPISALVMTPRRFNPLSRIPSGFSAKELEVVSDSFAPVKSGNRGNWGLSLIPGSKPLASRAGNAETRPAARKNAEGRLRAAANLAAARKMAPGSFRPTGEASAWSGFWSGEKAAGAASADPAAVSSLDVKRNKRRLLPSPKMAAAGVAFLSMVPMPALAALSKNAAEATAIPWWSKLADLGPFLTVPSILTAAYLAHRLISWTTRRLAGRLRWKSSTTDTARFISSTANWLLGLGFTLHALGISSRTLFTTTGLGLSLAVNKALANLLNAALFVVNRPFNVGDAITIDKVRYQVLDLRPKYAALKVLDSQNDRGQTAEETRDTYFTYTQLASKSIAIERPYDDPAGKMAPGKIFPSLESLWRALRDLPSSLFAKTLLWAAALFVAWGGAPLPHALHLFAARHFGTEALPIFLHALKMIQPYAQSLLVLFLSNFLSGLAEKFMPLLGREAGWDASTAAIVRLAAQLAAYLSGISLAVGIVGFNVGALIAGLGIGTAIFSVASSNLLGNVTQAIFLRWQSPFQVGQTLEVDGQKGEVLEIGLFYVVLKSPAGGQILVPYSAVDSSSLMVSVGR